MMEGLLKLKYLLEIDLRLQPQMVSSVYQERPFSSHFRPSGVDSQVERLAILRVQLLKGLDRFKRFEWTDREKKLIKVFLEEGDIETREEFIVMDCLVDDVICGRKVKFGSRLV